ncbi:hypothetical protein D8X55_00240 [Malacoplasma penetrans]|uniref:Uncharacterized protein n=1 Tax=Malacoplasma penetrans (strain HF-2) TaxID=272633 RepID=Q8EWX8_MALP2|nr:hypothetical protein [Malacoplasma penetrans]RXY97349.1 hypothetical protein D8X55_00240 [Malacoplasma penetrans]BAC43862.1 hypothetical protein [Malacoplasma penetrans HF-2]
MSLKKGENKNIKISLSSYKFFLKRKMSHLFVPKKKRNNLELKISLIFSLIYISLITNQRFWKLNKKTIIEVYDIFFVKCTDDLKQNLISILETATKKINYGFKLDDLNVYDLYDHVESFYSNCEILEYFKKMKKLKRVYISEEEMGQFITINQNLKFILNFIKITSPTRFNSIYRKLMNLV